MNGRKNIVKKLITLSLILTLIMGVASSAQAATRFSDVTDSSKYYYKPVYWAVDQKITKGYSDGKFKPQRDCSRREMMIFLWRLAGKPATTGKMKFTDVKYGKNTDSYKAILWGTNKSIIKGYPGNKFKPDNPVNRKDTMIMLYRFAGKPAATGTMKFSDCRTYGASSDTYKAILWGTNKGIAKGYVSGAYKGQFRPNDKCLREHIVTFIYRYKHPNIGTNNSSGSTSSKTSNTSTRSNNTTTNKTNTTKQNSKQSKDIIKVKGVEFDMQYFPKTLTFKWDEQWKEWGHDVITNDFLGFNSLTDINPKDITWVINNGKNELVRDPKTPNCYSDKEGLTNKYEYYVPNWKKAKVHLTTTYEEMYIKYRCEMSAMACTGSFTVSAYYKGALLRTCKVSNPIKDADSALKSFRDIINRAYNDKEIVNYVKGTTQVENVNAATKDTIMKIKCVMAYINKEYTYSQMQCTQGAYALFIAARDLGCKARIRAVGPNYDYGGGYGDSFYRPSGAGHECTIVTIAGREWIIETQGHKDSDKSDYWKMWIARYGY